MKLLSTVNKVGNVKDTVDIVSRARVLKKTKDMNKEKKKKAHLIIHGASAATAAVGAGFAQLPGSDATVIVPIQVTMVISLSKLFGRPLKEGAAKSLIMQTTATMVGRGVSEFLVGWIPVAGNIINASTAAAITETLGWIIANEFAEKSLTYTERVLDEDLGDDGIINASVKNEEDSEYLQAILQEVGKIAQVKKRIETNPVSGSTNA